MSYQNVFFGELKNPSFYSREGDELDGTEQVVYLPPGFTSHPLIEKKDFNIGFHINVYTPESIGVSFYLTMDPKHYGLEIGKNMENSVANIQTHIDREDGDLTIKWIGVNEDMRGQKLAQYLITLAMLYTELFDNDVALTVLDDDSDNYANGIEDPDKRKEAQSKNLYCKMGFVYEDDTGGPEMKGDVSEILKKNIKTFVKGNSRSLSSKSRSSSSNSRRTKRKTR